MAKKVFKNISLCIGIFIALSLIFFAQSTRSVCTVKASAETVKNESELDKELEEIIFEQLGKLDLTELQAYVDSLDLNETGDIASRLLAYIKGESVDYKTFGQAVLSVLLEKVIGLFPSFACVMAIALLSGLLSTLRGGTVGGTSAELIFLISYIASLLPLLAVLTECIQASKNAVVSMQNQMEILFPLMLTLLAASGGSLSVAVCRPAVAFFSTTIVSIVTSVVFPLTVAVIGLSIAGNLSKDLKINKFSVFFKSINKWIIGICVSIFGLFFTLQGLTSATYDGVVRRAAKYAIGNGIPIIGGFLSGGFDLAVAGSILIKNALGGMGILLMVGVLFEPLALLISVNVLLRLTSAVTQPFGDSRISDFLEETAANLQYCTAGLLFTAFLYFLSIIIMVCISEAFL